MAAGRSRASRELYVYCVLLGILNLSATVQSAVRASQETRDSRLLFPFRSYRDVQIFHFRVPQQAALAAFQFKANATLRCPSKQVAVHLQFGGYPVVSPDNATFPPLVKVERHSPHSVQLWSDSDAGANLNVSVPMPGDWFAIAYIMEDTGQIVQKGLFRTCQVWLTISAKYYTDDMVITLVNSVIHHSGVHNSQYFRFFAPDNTWSTRVSISTCTVIPAGSGTGCPLLIKARRKALPSVETHDVVVNCSENPNTTCHLEIVPAENDWNYLALEVLEQAYVEFDISADPAVCQQGTEGPLEIADTPQFSPPKLPKYMKQKKLRKSNATRSAAQRQRSMKPRSAAVNLPPSLSSCWPRIPLVRSNLPGNFAYRFDLVPDENGTTSVILNLTSINLMKFEVMPIVDSGGTLAVEIVLPPGINTTASNVSVACCLRYAVHPVVGPSGDCLQGWTLKINTSSKENEAGAIMVPYPETGLWYLSLMPRCYNDSAPEDDVPCASNQTEIIFQIKSAPCILGVCGDYGNCYQYISGGFIFSTCVCQAGWRGYGCTDDTEALSNAELLLAVILLTLSNILFVPAIVLALYRRFFTEACVYLATMVFSTLYHACDSEVYSVCVMRLSVLQFCDFYSAILSVWVTLIAMAELPLSLQSLAHMLGAVGVALGVEYDRTGIWVFVAPASLALLILIISWIRHCSRQHSCYPRRRLWLLCLLPGVLIAAAGLVLFTFLETKRNYQFVHSGWHAAMALSILFLLPERRHLKDSAHGVMQVHWKPHGSFKFLQDNETDML